MFPAGCVAADSPIQRTTDTESPPTPRGRPCGRISHLGTCRATPSWPAGMALTLVSMLALIPWLASADDGDVRSALDATAGWTDLLAQAAPNSRAGRAGRSRPRAGTIPAPSGRSTRRPVIWSAKGTAATSGCAGTRSSAMGSSTSMAVHAGAGQEGLQFGDLRPQLGRCPDCHQAQTGSGSGGYLFGQTEVAGKLKGINLSKQQKGSRVKPAGEWNTFEITCKGKDMSLWSTAPSQTSGTLSGPQGLCGPRS